MTIPIQRNCCCVRLGYVGGHWRGYGKNACSWSGVGEGTWRIGNSWVSRTLIIYIYDLRYYLDSCRTRNKNDFCLRLPFSRKVKEYSNIFDVCSIYSNFLKPRHSLNYIILVNVSLIIWSICIRENLSVSLPKVNYNEGVVKERTRLARIVSIQFLSPSSVAVLK